MFTLAVVLSRSSIQSWDHQKENRCRPLMNRFPIVFWIFNLSLVVCSHSLTQFGQHMLLLSLLLSYHIIIFYIIILTIKINICCCCRKKLEVWSCMLWTGPTSFQPYAVDSAADPSHFHFAGNQSVVIVGSVMVMGTDQMLARLVLKGWSLSDRSLLVVLGFMLLALMFLLFLCVVWCACVCLCFSLDNYVRDMFFTFSLAKILCVLSRDSLVASSLMSIAKRQKTFFYLVFAASLPQRLPLAISSSTLLGIVSVSIL